MAPLTSAQLITYRLKNPTDHDRKLFERRKALSDPGMLGVFSVEVNLAGPINATAYTAIRTKRKGRRIKKVYMKTAEVAAAQNYWHGYKEEALEQFAALIVNASRKARSSKQRQKREAETKDAISFLTYRKFMPSKPEMKKILERLEHRSASDLAEAYGMLGLHMFAATIWVEAGNTKKALGELSKHEKRKETGEIARKRELAEYEKLKQKGLEAPGPNPS